MEIRRRTKIIDIATLGWSLRQEGSRVTAMQQGLPQGSPMKGKKNMDAGCPTGPAEDIF